MKFILGWNDCFHNPFYHNCLWKIMDLRDRQNMNPILLVKLA